MCSIQNCIASDLRGSKYVAGRLALKRTKRYPWRKTAFLRFKLLEARSAAVPERPSLAPGQGSCTPCWRRPVGTKRVRFCEALPTSNMTTVKHEPLRARKPALRWLAPRNQISSCGCRHISICGGGEGTVAVCDKSQVERAAFFFLVLQSPLSELRFKVPSDLLNLRPRLLCG